MIVYLPQHSGYENLEGIFRTVRMDPDNREDTICDLCCFDHWCRHARSLGRSIPCESYNLPIGQDEYFEILEIDKIYRIELMKKDGTTYLRDIQAHDFWSAVKLAKSMGDLICMNRIGYAKKHNT